MLLAPACHDLAAVATWESWVKTGQKTFIQRYQNEYLTGEQFPHFNAAMLRLIELLELPGVGQYVSKAMHLLRTPYRWVKSWFSRYQRYARSTGAPGWLSRLARSSPAAGASARSDPPGMEITPISLPRAARSSTSRPVSDSHRRIHQSTSCPDRSNGQIDLPGTRKEPLSPEHTARHQVQHSSSQPDQCRSHSRHTPLPGCVTVTPRCLPDTRFNRSDGQNLCRCPVGRSSHQSTATL